VDKLRWPFLVAAIIVSATILTIELGTAAAPIQLTLPDPSESVSPPGGCHDQALSLKVKSFVTAPG